MNSDNETSDAAPTVAQGEAVPSARPSRVGLFLAHVQEVFRRVRSWLAPRVGLVSRGVDGLTDLTIFAATMWVVIAYRLLTVEPIEVGGDALKVWEFARHLAFGGEYPEKLNHHTSRFGLVIPAYLVQKLFGSSATVYYYAPLAASFVLHAAIFGIGRRLHGVSAGVISVCLLLLFEPMERASSQILPETFGPMYVAVSYYFAICFTQARGRLPRAVLLTLAAAAMFFAYGSKMSYLYFAPGLALLVWLGDEQTRDERVESVAAPSGPLRLHMRVLHWIKEKRLLVPATLALLVVGFLLVETVFLATSTSEKSHFSIMQGSHGGLKGRGPRIHDAGDFFALYTRAPNDWILAMCVGAVGALGVMAHGKKRAARLLGWALFIMVLLQTFIVRRLDPLTPWMEPHPRYLIAMAAPLAALTGLFLAGAGARVISREASSQPKDQSLARTGGEVALRMIVAGAILYSLFHDLPERWKNDWGRRDQIHRTAKFANELSDGFSRGLPIVSPSIGGKPAWASAAVMIDPALLLRDGRLPAYKEFTGRYQKGQFVARAFYGLPKKKWKELEGVVHGRVKRGKCVATLRQSARFMRATLRFDEGCPSLEEELASNKRKKKSAAKKKESAEGQAEKPRE